MKAYERLLKYVVVRTPSDENSETVPSSQCQFDLAKILKEEMEELGLRDVVLDDQCYLYGKLPATPGYEDKTSIGFIAHMDTVSDFCDQDIHPVITENYNGEDLPLGDSGLVLSTETFPHLKDLKGRTLITTDGHTVLGADDKAGIAEILTLIEYLNETGMPHGPISVAFTPDEEIGTGASHFNVEQFGAKYGYTLDGDTEGEIQYENFNAASAVFTIHGFCQRMLSLNAFESGMLFEQQLIEDESRLRYQACADFWRRHCYPLPREIAAVIHEAWKGPRDLLKSLDRWLQGEAPQLKSPPAAEETLAERHQQIIARINAMKTQCRD